MITLNINVTKIDKTALVEGEKGKYLNLALFDKPDQYGNDGFVVQDIPRHRRDQGEKGPIIGNWKERGAKREQDRPAPQSRQVSPDLEDDIPF